jgi:hypothetical protein
MWNNCRTLNGCVGGENRYAFGRLATSQYPNQRLWNTLRCGNLAPIPLTVTGGNVSYDTGSVIGECFGNVTFVRGSSTGPWQLCTAMMTVSDRVPNNPLWDEPSCVGSLYGANSAPVATVSCPAGEQPSGSPTAPCEPCPPYTYKPMVGAGMCTTCGAPQTFGSGAAAGTATSTPNATRTACDPMFSCDTAGYTLPSGISMSNLASQSCSPATSTPTTTPPSTTPTCPGGQYYSTATGACTGCPSPSNATYGHPITGGSWASSVAVDAPGNAITNCRASYTCFSAPGTFYANYVSDSTPGYDGDCAASCGTASHPLGVNATLDSGGSCACKPGFFISNGSCTVCPAGTYKDVITNATSCTTCPITGVTPIAGMGGNWNSVTSPPGSTSVSACCASYFCGSYGPAWRQAPYTGASCSVSPPPSSPSCGAAAPALPPAISYSGSPYTFQPGGAIPTKTPTSSGGPISSCTSSPALPSGLSLAATTCAISGTPTADTPAANYTITASNAGGSGSATISITISSAPVYPSYPQCSQTTCTTGTKITNPDINVMYSDPAYCGNGAACTFPTHSTNTASCGGPGSTCGDCYINATTFVYVRCKQ